VRVCFVFNPISIIRIERFQFSAIISFYYSRDEFLCSFVFIFALALRLLKHKIISLIFLVIHIHQVFCCCHCYQFFFIFPLLINIMKALRKKKLNPKNNIIDLNVFLSKVCKSVYLLVFVLFISAFSFLIGLVFF